MSKALVILSFVLFLAGFILALVADFSLDTFIVATISVLFIVGLIVSAIAARPMLRLAFPLMLLWVGIVLGGML